MDGQSTQALSTLAGFLRDILKRLEAGPVKQDQFARWIERAEAIVRTIEKEVNHE